MKFALSTLSVLLAVCQLAVAAPADVTSEDPTLSAGVRTYFVCGADYSIDSLNYCRSQGLRRWDI